MAKYDHRGSVDIFEKRKEECHICNWFWAAVILVVLISLFK